MRPLDPQPGRIDAGGDQRPRRGEPNDVLGQAAARPASRWVRKSDATVCRASARCHGSGRA
jgi:hypothetical protein